MFNWNNIYGNSDYDFYNDTPQGAADMNAEYNWWGTIDYEQIMAHIWDWFDDPSLALVDYDPWLASHSLLAPISPPTGLAASSDVITVTLTWSPNPEADLAGYKVYYDADGPGFPYAGTGASQGDAPIDVGNVLSATLTGLAPGTYYLSVTAYDTAADGEDDQTDGHESWFAYEVTALVGEEPHAELFRRANEWHCAFDCDISPTNRPATWTHAPGPSVMGAPPAAVTIRCTRTQRLGSTPSR